MIGVKMPPRTLPASDEIDHDHDRDPEDAIDASQDDVESQQIADEKFVVGHR